MALIDANASRTGSQETQFISNTLLEGVYLDQDERTLRDNRLNNGAGGEFTSVSDSYHLTDNLDPDNTLNSGSLVQQSPIAAKRILAPDLLRGFVMVLQAVDHAAVMSTAYSHGQAIIGEEASENVTQWNEPVGYTLRLLSHLCAPGFLFLLGMGVVYFGRSRTKVGWGTTRLIRHFFIRAVVIFVTNWLISMILVKRIWPMLNTVLLALAFDYLLAGLIWLATTWTEPRLGQVILHFLPGSSRNSDTQSLLHVNPPSSYTGLKLQNTAKQISFHAHNAALLFLCVIAVWWNIWLDPRKGHCPDFPDDPSNIIIKRNVWFEFFFHKIRNRYVFSGIPPLAWLSPAILGIVYARIATSRPWQPLKINFANIATGTGLLFLFVLTRLLRFGNLDEDCLTMPEHLANPGINQYLASAQSFFYIIKYPPSPSYVFFTMGCNFLALGLFGFVPTRATRRFPFSILMIFGTSALFFFTLHLPLYQVLGSVAKQVFGHKMDFNDPRHPESPAWGVGTGIIFWVDLILGLLILWPVCESYARFKATKGVDSIWRFF